MRGEKLILYVCYVPHESSVLSGSSHSCQNAHHGRLRGVSMLAVDGSALPSRRSPLWIRCLIVLVITLSSLATSLIASCRISMP